MEENENEPYWLLKLKYYLNERRKTIVKTETEKQRMQDMKQKKTDYTFRPSSTDSKSSIKKEKPKVESKKRKSKYKKENHPERAKFAKNSKLSSPSANPTQYIGTRDLLKENLDVIFVGFNPGLTSGTLGHHYSGPNNQFYSMLHLSGITSRKFHFSEDALLLDYGIGLTNIVPRTTRGSGELSKDELKQGAAILIEKVNRYNPMMVCFNGMGIFEACAGKKIEPGLQAPGSVPSLKMPLFVVPSSSGRVAGYQLGDKVLLLKEMKRILDQLKDEKKPKNELDLKEECASTSSAKIESESM